MALNLNDEFYRKGIDIKGIHYNVILNLEKRKTISGRIDFNNIIISLPSNLPDKLKDSYYIRIRNRLIKRIESGKVLKQFNFYDKEDISIAGKQFKLRLGLTNLNRFKTFTDKNSIHVTIPIKFLTDENRINKKIISELIKVAKPLVYERVNYVNNLYFKFKVDNVKIYGFKKNVLASCNSKTKTLFFSLNSIMFPSDVLDSIIVHELAHLKYPNHSSKFWNLVLSVVPDYKSKKDWIDKNFFRIN